MVIFIYLLSHLVFYLFSPLDSVYCTSSNFTDQFLVYLCMFRPEPELENNFFLIFRLTMFLIGKQFVSYFQIDYVAWKAIFEPHVYSINLGKGTVIMLQMIQDL